MNLQKTIKEPIEFKGVGLHNGIKVNLCLKPAEINSGIKFKRTDVDNTKSIIEASYKNVSSPVLCTKIKNSHGVSVSTIEHLMAAFYLEAIDNVLVEIDAPEVPIMDGSAFDFVEDIKSFGTQEQKYSKKFIKVVKKVEVRDGVKHISIEPLTKDLIIDFEIVYKNPLIRTRKKVFKLSNGDLTSIYNSRSFCLYEDIDQIKNRGLAKGGSLENAIVVKENKILNDNGLRSRDEFVNHKILDCLGDLMLSGHRIFGHIKTSQGGHQLTNTLLRKFLLDNSNWEFESFEEKDNKDSSYLRPIAVNA
ncbi:MAG TPA: UDP-3-O-acyl-N-acetylglucosamine deacetylase [Pelagibacteraceae bacterium]|jgi:UDP-3-O-[3-hydroxymyristoyl] N-acetylglucosamine deacetylase|nr:UDP-3-O-acyl-N-acetylglucosamine deacetylase [Pelagibacteraceae bacterium]|tara:strand:+ start:3179 stop:4093 length:915 start_codon:yes stop_codon:yes gene_type:complete